MLYTITSLMGLQLHTMGKENKDWGERHLDLAFNKDLITYLPHLSTSRGRNGDPGVLMYWVAASTRMMYACSLDTMSADEFGSLCWQRLQVQTAVTAA